MMNTCALLQAGFGANGRRNGSPVGAWHHDFSCASKSTDFFLRRPTYWCAAGRQLKGLRTRGASGPSAPPRVRLPVHVAAKIEEPFVPELPRRSPELPFLLPHLVPDESLEFPQNSPAQRIRPPRSVMPQPSSPTCVLDR